MKIKSDETPKTNRLAVWMKEHQTSDITKTLLFTTFTLFSVIGLFVLLEGVITKKDVIENANEAKDVENIIKYQPVIKCNQHYYLPDEYELEVKGGRNKITIEHVGRDLHDTYYLTDCTLVLSKTKDTVSENFKESLFKKRGYVSDKVAEERRIKSASLKKVTLKDLARKQSENSTSNIAVYDNDTDRTKVMSTMHTSDYYLKLEYASLYPVLVKATKNLIAYRLTDEYKELKQVRFASNDRFRELNSAYNSVHGTMWRLHQRFGTKYGDYSRLKSGKLIVTMINGKLEFGYTN